MAGFTITLEPHESATRERVSYRGELLQNGLVRLDARGSGLSGVCTPRGTERRGDVFGVDALELGRKVREHFGYPELEPPRAALERHVSGAIARGDAEPITEQRESAAQLEREDAQELAELERANNERSDAIGE